MSLFDMLAKAATGGNNRGNSSNHVSSGYNRNTAQVMLYQCRYCGRRERITNPMFLPNGGTGCRVRGKDSRGHALNHVWERL